ncbi:MAG: transposase [Bacteroidales bacterium]|nr:transposase [Bacteroidales bacterium]
MTYNPQKHHRRSIRLKGYDYSQAGLYFITICTHNRACLFGKIENSKMILNECGQIANNEWEKTPEIRNNVELGDFIIMPNHIHIIIRLLGRGELHSPNNPNKLHSPNKQGVCDTPLRSPSQTIGAIVRGYKSSITKQLGLLGFNGKLWQRNYHEHIIRNEQSYMKISEYIINNPANWDNDSLK